MRRMLPFGVALAGCIPPYPVTAVDPGEPACPDPCTVTGLADAVWYGDGRESWAGDALDPLGSVDGALAAGFVVGAKFRRTGDGGAYVVIDQDTAPGGRSLGEARLTVVWDVAGKQGLDARLGSAVVGVRSPADGSHQALAIAAQGADDWQGAVWVASGDIDLGAEGVVLGLTDALAGTVPGVTASLWTGTFTEGADPEVGADLAGGDFDGDGLADLAIGSYRGAWVISDAVSGSGSRSLEDASVSLVNPAEAGQSGCSVAILPDFDGTGEATLAVGACLAAGLPVDEGTTGPDGEGGAVVLVSHRDAPEGSVVDLNTTHDRVLFGAPGDHLGVAAYDAGDLDHDGFGDLLIEGHSCGAEGNLCDAYGAAVWYVIGGSAQTGVEEGPPFLSAPWTFELRLDPTQESCNGGTVGEFGGAEDWGDLAVGWCPEESGGVVALMDLCAEAGACVGDALHLPADEADPRLMFIAGGAGPSALVGAEVDAAGGHLLVGAWKADSLLPEPANEAGAVYVLDLPTPGP